MKSMALTMVLSHVEVLPLATWPYLALVAYFRSPAGAETRLQALLGLN